MLGKLLCCALKHFCKLCASGVGSAVAGALALRPQLRRSTAPHTTQSQHQFIDTRHRFSASPRYSHVGGLEDWRLTKQRRTRVRVPCGALFSFFLCLFSRLLLPSRLPTCGSGESARALGPPLRWVKSAFFFFFFLFALLSVAGLLVCWAGPGALAAGGSAPAHTPHTGARGVAIEKKGKKGKRRRRRRSSRRRRKKWG